jgi:glycosyltransferase involved in cell wall biosynthesis
MTIIHLTVGLGGGGAESFLLEISKSIKKNPGTKVVIVTLTSISTIAYKFDAENIQYISLGIKGVKDFFLKFERFLNILKKHDSCIVHAHMFHAAMAACLAKLFRPNIRIVFTLHTNFVKQAYRKWLLFVTKKLRSADIIFSPDSRRWYHKKNAITIANGIDTSKFNLENTTSDTFTCLFLGRLAEPKNPLYLIELVNRLKDRFKFKILVAGTGPLKTDLEEQIRKYKLEEYFSLLGFTDNIPKLLSKAHCLIMPSLWEGMPMAILEAGAAGVPIVATPVGSIPSILNTENAYLGNLDEFHLLLEKVMLEYKFSLKKAEELRRKIYDDYDISKSAKKHLELYSHILIKNQTFAIH